METQVIEQPKSFPQNVVEWPAKVKDYYADLTKEMRLVTWPSRKQVEATTMVVIVSVFLFAAYFGIVDFLVGRSIEKLFAALTK